MSLDKCNRNQGQSRKAIVLCKFSQPPVRLLLEKRYVQIAAGAPFAAGDVLQAAVTIISADPRRRRLLRRHAPCLSCFLDAFSFQGAEIRALPS